MLYSYKVYKLTACLLFYQQQTTDISAFKLVSKNYFFWY